jgi:hypothetical protein
MTTNGQFSRVPPDKANELFEKLIATSNTAIRSRERLLAELKQELELLATLQEEHLFPVLTIFTKDLQRRDLRAGRSW